MPPVPSKLNRDWGRWLALGAFAILWLDLVRLLSTQWEAREQYAYGYFVPVLALGLFWKKWPSRPLLGTLDYSTTRQQDCKSLQQTGNRTSEVSDKKAMIGGTSSTLSCRNSNLLYSAFHRVATVGGSWSVISRMIVLVAAAALLPLRIIYEVNEDWPLVSWLYTLIVVALTLYALHLADPQRLTSDPRSLTQCLMSMGHSPWLKHFAFPACFILTAVVWPYRFEHGLTQGLMRAVAAVTVEVLSWCDIPALQRGNLIELSSGTVGIDEACSGIRSFHSSLTAGLFMGELYYLRLVPRIVLLIVGVLLAFCLNVLRTLFLSCQADKAGLGAIGRWHDPAGLAITLACFVVLWTLAVIINKKTTG